MSVRINTSAAPIEGFSQGLPYIGDAVAVDLSAAVTHHHQGLPFTADGKLAAVVAAPDYFGSGAAPFTSAGRLAVSSNAASKYLAGVTFDASGSVATE